MGCLSQLEECGNSDLSRWLETCQGRCRDLEGKCEEWRSLYHSVQIDGCIEGVFEEFREKKKVDCLLITDDCKLLLVEVKSANYNARKVLEQFRSVVELLSARLVCHLDLIPVLYAEKHDRRQQRILHGQKVRYKGRDLTVVT
ncbi:MAG: hypothetical protein ACK4SY_10520, partial [Pyrobaculum sp.]